MKRPIYRLTINETDEGMDFVGLVDDPAHSKKWITMSSTSKKKPVRYRFDNEKKIVRGVVLATQQLIYRRDPDGFEYDVYFTKEDSEKILEMFARKGYHNNLNIMHDQGKKVSDVALIEMLTVDDKRSNIPEGFQDQNLQPGSIIFSYKINNDKDWKFVKEHGAGFSLEGWFSQVEVKFKKTKPKSKTMKKSLLEKLGFKAPDKKEFDADNKDKYETATAASGETLYWEGDLAEGNTLFIVPEGGDPAADGVLANGTYEFEVDGVAMTVATDESGVITSVSEGEEMEEENEEMAAVLQAMKADYEARDKNRDNQIKLMAEAIEDLTEAVEKLADGKDTHKKKVPSGKVPGWKGMKNAKKD